ncbi:hypothetical protein, partial [Rhizobium sp. Pop5]|uniref:hypothetical protein n=1 Tax=Rhizobium sp. Pop5 TaxID=1223565 RepID=UPI001969E442
PWPSAGTSAPFWNVTVGIGSSCMIFSILEEIARRSYLSSNPVIVTMMSWHQQFRAVMLT